MHILNALIYRQTECNVITLELDNFMVNSTKSTSVKHVF